MFGKLKKAKLYIIMSKCVIMAKLREQCEDYAVIHVGKKYPSP
jgi:hypothetical protein